MKSFRQIMLAICVILIASAFAGCGADTDLPDKRPVLGKIEYTNLNDSGSRELLQGLLSDAGVSDGRIQGFFRRVWYLPKKKIYVNGNAAVKVCKGVDEQTAFQDEIFRIFGFF